MSRLMPPLPLPPAPLQPVRATVTPTPACCLPLVYYLSLGNNICVQHRRRQGSSSVGAGGREARVGEGAVGWQVTAMTGSHDLPFTIFIYS